MGEDLILIKRNGNRVPLANRRTATVVTSAKQNWALNAEDTVEISITSPFPQTYAIGDKITVFGRDYTLNRLPKPKKDGMRNFQYTLQFEGVQYDLLRVTYDVTIDTTNNQAQDVLGESLIGNLHRYLTVLVANANRVFPGKWALGVVPETAQDVSMSFGESDNCLSVLQSILGKFDSSYYFDIVKEDGVYVINIRSVSETLPYTLTFGRGGGLYSLTRDNVSSSNIVTRLKVYGSTSNITSKYRADRLCLPGRSKSLSYIEKPEAIARYGIFEGRKHFEDIKPSFTGHVQRLGKTELEFIDTTLSFDLNEKDADGNTKYMIAGTSPKVHFNTGNLAGYEFELSKYDHDTHKVTLRRVTDQRGDSFPSATSEAFRFKAASGNYPGDEYKILDITYPDSFIAKAESELLAEAEKYYEQNSQPKVSYSVSVSKEFLERKYATEAGFVNVFTPGQYIRIKDEDIDVDKSIRIKSISRNILSPYEYSLSISDTVTTSVTNRVLSDIIEIDKVLTLNELKDPTRARANWRTSREVMDMVFDPDGDYYTDKIKPNSIDTLALSVGAKSMQFGLTNTVFQPNYNGNPQILKWQGGVLTHYTIKDDAAVAWVLADGQITMPTNNQAYYIYAKCNKNGTDGTIVITPNQYKVDADANWYYFWIGVVNSVDAELNARSIALSYGFSMINGRFIKTGCVQSADGSTYFDLDNGEIGGRIVFNSNGEQKTLEELGQEALDAKTYIDTTLQDTISDISTQLDGKIESWFQSADPATEWVTEDERSKHVGDMWYNTTEKCLSRYCVSVKRPIGKPQIQSFYWNEVQDQTAIDAYSLANQANTTKRQVFLDSPWLHLPYDKGDLWLDGKDLRHCITSRFSDDADAGINDWVLSVAYDNTKTVIDGGLVTSGTIQVAGDEHSILAGITGAGTANNEIRMWSGAAFENRKTAPFRVQQNGKVFMTDADVTGRIKATSGEFSGTINALSGKIGGLSIRGNDLVGLDANGGEVVKIGLGALPGIGSAFATKHIDFTIGNRNNYPPVVVDAPEGSNGWMHAAARCAGYMARDSYATPPQLVENTTMGCRVSFSLAQGVSSLTLARFAPGYETQSASTGTTVNASGDGTLYKIVNEVRTKVKDFTIDPQGDDVNVDALLPGDYEIDIRVTLSCSGTYWEGNVCLWIDGGILVTYADSAANTTILAPDGILVVQGTDKYLCFSATNGFETRFGDHGIKVSSSGTQMLVNGTWKTIQNKT